MTAYERLNENQAIRAAEGATETNELKFQVAESHVLPNITSWLFAVGRVTPCKSNCLHERNMAMCTGMMNSYPC